MNNTKEAFNPITDRYAPWEVQPPKRAFIHRNMWTEAEDKIIKDNLHLTYPEVHKLLGPDTTRTPQSVCNRLGKYRRDS